MCPFILLGCGKGADVNWGINISPRCWYLSVRGCENENFAKAMIMNIKSVFNFLISLSAY